MGLRGRGETAASSFPASGSDGGLLRLAYRSLARRKLRSGLTLFGVSLAVALLASLLAFGKGYKRELTRELDGMGIQMMLVPLGCPYDAAARVLKGNALDVSLPASAFEVTRKDRAVENAAPLLMAAVPRPTEGRTDLWVGITKDLRSLKPWWKLKAGSHWFSSENGPEVILGEEAAQTELRQVGDRLYSPETGKTLRVVGILERSGTADDSQFFVPLGMAQAMFHQPERLTAVAVRLKDPSLTGEAAARLQTIPGAQIVTMTEMMGTFLNLVGAVRTLIQSLAALAVVVSALAVLTTMLSSVLERTGEIGILRAVGASRGQVFGLLALESALLALLGSLGGVGLAAVTGKGVEAVVRQFVALAPSGSLLSLSADIVFQCCALGLGIGVVSGVYPAWQGSRLSPIEAVRREA